MGKPPFLPRKGTRLARGFPRESARLQQAIAKRILDEKPGLAEGQPTIELAHSLSFPTKDAIDEKQP